MKTKALIADKLEQVEKELFQRYQEKPSMSLLTGNAGLALFYYNMHKNFQQDIYRERTEILLEHVMAQLNDGIRSFTYCDGLTGLAFLLNYLYEKEFLDDTIVDFLKQCDDILFDVFERMQQKRNTDLLHGSLGLAAYFLDRYHAGFLSMDRFTLAGEAMRHNLDLITGLATVPASEASKDVFINCGMAHGTISLISFLSRYHELAANKQEIATSIKAGVDNLMQYKSTDPASVAVFPSIVKLSGGSIQSTYEVPLGWCYGDTIISIGLYHAAKALNDEVLMQEAEELALTATRRNTPKKAIIHDACLCHGGAGLAHMYRKWYGFTGNKIFEENYQLWMEQTLELCYHDGGYGGFKKYNGGPFIEVHGLLDGAAGMGLVLTDYLGENNDSSDWDRVLMMS
ncbi:lanthionine synthetase C family protein [Chitinophaga sp. Hz27]|uniref:lanthionine synthetase C family protein n=1 Tax=Chitinophaga sp. Hz27 TaxID=3347169 RepID=UPI0035DA69A7